MSVLFRKEPRPPAGPSLRVTLDRVDADKAPDDPPEAILAELRAMGCCFSELIDLDDAARCRVLVWLAETCGLGVFEIRRVDAGTPTRREGDAA